MKYELVPKDVIDSTFGMLVVARDASSNPKIKQTLDKAYTKLQMNRTAVNVQPETA